MHRAKANSLLAGTEVVSGNCAFCGSTLNTGEHVVDCPACSTIYHADCWYVNGNKCAALGCSGKGRPTSARVAASAAVQIASSQVIRIRPIDIQRALRRSVPSLRSTSTLLSLWSSPISGIALGAFLSLLLGICYHTAALGVAAALRPEQTYVVVSLPLLSPTGFSTWPLAGALYGLLRWKFMISEDGQGYRLIRSILVVVYLGLLAVLFSQLVFTPLYGWLALPAATTAALLRISVALAVMPVLLVIVGGIRAYQSSFSLFRLVAIIGYNVALTVFPAYGFALAGGALLALGAWALGASSALPSIDRYLGMGWAGGAPLFGVIAGFLVGLRYMFRSRR
jgi:hypothetical protein